MQVTIEIWEYVFALFIAAFSLLLTFAVEPHLRKFFLAGISGRLLGGLFFGLVYLLYYGGGDTTAYYQTAHAVVNLMVEDVGQGFRVWFGGYSPENRALFSTETGRPAVHIFVDPSSYAVSQVLVPFLLLSFNSYLIATVLFSVFFFYGPWMLFKAVRTIVVGSPWLVAIPFLLVPSVLFWGSGISKDTITYSASCYFVYGVLMLFIKKKVTVLRVVLTSVAGALLLLIKPYIFIVLLPGTLLWTLFSQVQRIQSVWLRRFILPILILFSIVGVALIYSQLSGVLGDYGVDKILDKAIVTQEDLKQDYYGGNNFDIGTIEPTFFGLLSKFPIASFYGLYGPTLLEIRSPIMLFAALENTFLLVYSLLILLSKPIAKFRRLRNSPFLIFCLLYTLLFGFSIGLTTPNYGALVRFKIPLLPFFVIFLMVINFTKSLKLEGE